MLVWAAAFPTARCKAPGVRSHVREPKAKAADKSVRPTVDLKTCTGMRTDMGMGPGGYCESRWA